MILYQHWTSNVPSSLVAKDYISIIPRRIMNDLLIRNALEPRITKLTRYLNYKMIWSIL